MGNSSSSALWCVNGSGHSSCSHAKRRGLVVPDAPAWSQTVVPIERWKEEAGHYGFGDELYVCTEAPCEPGVGCRCLQYVKLEYTPRKQSIVIRRYRCKILSIPMKEFSQLTRCIELGGFMLNEFALAVKEHLMVGMMHKGNLQSCESIFLVLNTEEGRALGYIRTPRENMSVSECHISPDLKVIALLFLFNTKHTVYLYKVDDLRQPMKVMDLQDEIRPYLAFHPAYGHSKMAMVHFRDRFNEIRISVHDLLEDRIVQSRNTRLPHQHLNGYLALHYTPDARYLCLQWLYLYRTLGLSRWNTELYVLNSDKLQCVWRTSTRLRDRTSMCGVNYITRVSRCCTKLLLLDATSSDAPTSQLARARATSPVPPQWARLVTLPRTCSLKAQCRAAILQLLNNSGDVQNLPLPKPLKEYLKFKPQAL